MDTTDIRDEIDRSFGAGPATGGTDAFLDDLLTRGRRVVRVRQALLATGTAAALVAAVLGTTAALDGSPDAAGRHLPVATDPSPTSTSPSTIPTTAPTRPPTHAEILKVLRRGIVMYDDAGNLYVDPTATVLRRLANPLGVPAPNRSVALALVYQGQTYWFERYWNHDGSSGGASAWAGEKDQTFMAWVRDQQGMADGGGSVVGPDVWPGVADLNAVRFVGDTEQLEPVNGTTILDQRPHVQVGTSFARPTDQTAAAEVKTSDGKAYYVLARRFDGKTPQYIAVPHDFGGATLDDFLKVARQRYAEGGGGLL